VRCPVSLPRLGEVQSSAVLYSRLATHVERRKEQLSIIAAVAVAWSEFRCGEGWSRNLSGWGPRSCHQGSSIGGPGSIGFMKG
jgi:hypothetical protein